MIFGYQSSIIQTSVDIHISIQAGISTQDILQWISVSNKYSWINIHAFMDIH